MSNKLARPRLAAFNRQSGCCHYCSLPIWQECPQAFAAKYRISVKQAALFRCTAEHVLACQDGGGNSEANIVAACWVCNQRRHRGRKCTDANKYLSLVQRRVKQKRWHFAWVYERLAVPQSATF